MTDDEAVEAIRKLTIADLGYVPHPRELQLERAGEVEARPYPEVRGMRILGMTSEPEEGEQERDFGDEHVAR